MLLLPGMLLADVTGSILGVVRDPSQAVIKGAQITITNTQTNLSQSTVSADDGSYHFLALPVGTYKLSASMTGFQQYSATDIVLKVNDQLRIDFSLTVGSVNEHMTIEANSVQVETESTQLGDVIDSKKKC
ncbi:MAG TPA: carboxypeptidase-like regulatory domain-containing protein [Candidatus Sulfotelmatobacter sp.]|nr:carboxypeptidase-like regulatory domain-containing protein [Candidatus Sulfotelmatobacter sp.]